LAVVLIGIRPAIGAPALLVLIFFENSVPSGLAVPVLLVAVGMIAFGWTRLPPPSAPLAWAAGFALWAFASSLWANDLAKTTEQYLGLALALCFLLALPVLIGSEADLRMFFGAFVLLAVVTGIVGIAAVASGEVTRAAGGADEPNAFAMYQVIAFPFALLLAATGRSAWVRAAGYAALPVIIAAVLAAGSRGGLIALGVATALIMLVPSIRLYRSSRHGWTLAAVVGVALVASLPLVLPSLSDRLSREDSAAGSGRVNEWRTAIKAFGEEPVAGLGFGGYYVASNRLLRSTPEVDLRRFRIVSPGVRVHSAYFGVAAELGLIGLALFAGLLISTALALRRPRDGVEEEPFIAQARGAVLVALSSFATASLFLSTEASFILFALVGLTVVLDKLRVSGARAA
jgi:O-antigen ligase